MKVFKVKVFWFFKSFSVIESTDDNKLTRRIQTSLNSLNLFTQNANTIKEQRSPMVEMHQDYSASKGIRGGTVRLLAFCYCKI